MSRWKDEFENHEIHRIVENVLALLDEKRDHLSADEQIELRRLNKVIAAFAKALSQLDGELIPIDSLNQIHRNFDSVVNCMNAYANQNNTQNLIDANNYLSSILPQISQLIIFAKKAPALRSVREFEENLDNLYSQFDTKCISLDQGLSEVSTSIEEQSQSLEQLVADFNYKKEEITATVSSWEEKFSDEQNERDEKFSDSQKEKNNTYYTWEKDFEDKSKERINNLFEKNEQYLIEKQKTFETKISDYIQKSEEKYQRILGLYQLAAEDSVAGSYQRNAEDEKKQASFWRWASIVFIVFTVFWLGISYWFDSIVMSGGIILWGKLLKSFSMVGVLLLGAGFAAKQSRLHRLNEQRTRWFALEVKAFDPFIQSLDEENKKVLKAKLSEKIFGQNPIQSNGKNITINENIIAEKVFDLIKTYIKNLSRNQ